jgi:hypothetical protein
MNAINSEKCEQASDFERLDRAEVEVSGIESPVEDQFCPATAGAWEKIPQDCVWITVDSDGEVCAWKVKPYLLGNGEWEIDEYTPDTEQYNYGWVDEQEPKIWERPT